MHAAPCNCYSARARDAVMKTGKRYGFFPYPCLVSGGLLGNVRFGDSFLYRHAWNGSSAWMRRFATLLAAFAFMQSASALAAVSCERTTISAIQRPAGPAESQSGSLTFADGRHAIFSADDYENMRQFAMRTMRTGDRVMTCIGKPYYRYRNGPPVSQISVMDETANFIFTSLNL